MSYKVIDRKQRNFASQGKMIITKYGVRKTKNQDKLLDNILKFANRKSGGMSKHNVYKDYEIGVVLEYENGSYATVNNFVLAGEEIDVMLPEYDEQIIKDRGKIKSFFINIKNR
jgi:hypothetical protein